MTNPRTQLFNARRKASIRWYARHVALWGGLWLAAVVILIASMVTAVILNAPAPAQRGSASQYGIDYDSQRAQHCRSSHATDEDCDG